MIPFEVPRADEPATESDLSGVLEALSAADSGLALEATGDPRVAFDLSGPRALLPGRQDGRIEELGSPAYRVLGDHRFGIDRKGQRTAWSAQARPPAAPNGTLGRPEGYTQHAVTVQKPTSR